ncbi:hypothetical protein GWI33_016431 [Rhynchophorus ferrugineus]|uniref:Uncharacterized protein n=1 Tax=Rhynchophorus ferrugineus TaxID=354439 RepID=A0A834HY20_RHYFE|nr:hypothetical protein GWI33_016431 [Rhynchophorus ferrugineus]
MFGERDDSVLSERLAIVIPDIPDLERGELEWNGPRSDADSSRTAPVHPQDDGSVVKPTGFELAPRKNNKKKPRPSVPPGEKPHDDRSSSIGRLGPLTPSSPIPEHVLE